MIRRGDWQKTSRDHSLKIPFYDTVGKKYNGGDSMMFPVLMISAHP